MDLEKIIKELNEKQKIESGKEYNLGNFINDLKKYKDEFLYVEFDDGTIPTEFNSWRGSYCELSLGYDSSKTKRISDLYRDAFNANGSMFYGYKGGEFIMDLATPIHQDNYGECINKKIIGIEKINDKLIIKTRLEEY